LSATFPHDAIKSATSRSSTSRAPSYSVRFRIATEPNTNAARSDADNGFNAARNGSARATVFSTMLRSSAKIGDVVFA